MFYRELRFTALGVPYVPQNIVWSSPSGPMILSFAAGSVDGGNQAQPYMHHDLGSIVHWGALSLYALCRTNYSILGILRSVVFLFAVAGQLF